MPKPNTSDILQYTVHTILEGLYFFPSRDFQMKSAEISFYICFLIVIHFSPSLISYMYIVDIQCYLINEKY